MSFKNTEAGIAYYERFLTDVRTGGLVFAIKNEDGFPLFDSNHEEDRKVMLFWGDGIRAKVFRNANHGSAEIVSIPVAVFREHRLQGMQVDRYLVGSNWDKERYGAEIEPDEILLRLQL